MNEIDIIDLDEPSLSFGAALKQNVSYIKIMKQKFRKNLNLKNQKLIKKKLLKKKIISVTSSLKMK